MSPPDPDTVRRILELQDRVRARVGPEVDVDALIREMRDPGAHGPGGYVVITFGSPPSEVCTWPACPMSAEWFPDHEAARRYMARLPGWTDPHQLPVSDLVWRTQGPPPATPEREKRDHD